MEVAEPSHTTHAQTREIKPKSCVTFQDGKALTSADVVFSKIRHLDGATGSKVNSIAKPMSGILAVDPLPGKRVLAAPNADLPTILSLHRFMAIAEGATAFTTAHGRGAFLCDVFEPGAEPVGLRIPTHLKPGDAINPRSMLMRDGQAHLAHTVATAGNRANLNNRNDMHPGDKADFTEVLKHLVNREAIQNSMPKSGADISLNPYDKLRGDISRDMQARCRARRAPSFRPGCPTSTRIRPS